ncbi:sigma-70 family RNA polymerase sigma factor [Erythrobacter sp.]|uniref:sigma-70 family RNA polymerase sigma factor n=1 Tax=Erythrobacter sp. TaxID=1042 RepID=UPI001425CFF3|nr:sigma-70 family RNA polymerase sigma factor [Erythrobacter sp.]QIQ86543.1 MAG: sigma-70 family RNA polymerase sigma factor [Erythrobacter sp.]
MSTANADDAALVARIAAREEAALREAIAAHAGMVHRVAYRMLGDAHEAEDIAQEAMLRLWDKAPGITGRAIRLGPWLKRVAVNLSIDRLRQRRRNAGEDVPERADEAPLADALLEADQRDAAARALIATLPERQRAAIVLTYYEEMPNAEAAETMDMNIKAFESLLHRARAALRKAFEEQRMAEGDAA